MERERLSTKAVKGIGLGILVGLILWALLIGVAVKALGATWSPPDSGVAPVYCPQDIPVIDAVSYTLGPVHLQKWYAGRNAAFAEWGLPFSITEGQEAVQFTDANVNSGAVFDNDIVDCAIILVKDRTTNPGDSAGWWEGTPTGSGGIAALNPWSGWWQSQTNISSIVGHEVGHALGFAHGGTGVMSGSAHVNATEQGLAADYYHAQGFVF